MSLVLVIDDSPTILRVIELILTKAGYDVITASDGEEGLEVARARLPDLILLDFIMPKLNGYQFCRELAADPQIQHTPVVLISAKGEQVGARFMRVLGVVDYVSKPFTADGLLAVVDRAMDKFRKPVDQTTRPLISDEEAASEARQLRALSAAAAELDTIYAPHLAPHRSAEDWLRKTLQPTLQRLPLAATGLLVASDLSVVPAAPLLHLVGELSLTGLLVITRDDSVAVELTLERGYVQAVAARGLSDDHSLDRWLVQTSILSREALRDAREQLTAATGSAPSEQQLAEHLVQAGLVREADIQACISRQSSELIFETLRWSHGDAKLFPLAPLELAARSQNQRLDIEGLLMEGHRRIDEWHLITPAIESLDAVFVKNEDVLARLGLHRLSEDEQAALAHIDGRHSVKDIIANTHLGTFEAYQVLYRLLNAKLIRRRAAPIATR